MWSRYLIVLHRKRQYDTNIYDMANIQKQIQYNNKINIIKKFSLLFCMYINKSDISMKI